MMLALGMFVFELRTLPYQSMQHSKDYRWVSNDRVGKPPAYQFLGEGETSIQLAGTLYPAITGGRISLRAVELMADEGRAWPLIEGTGNISGCISSIKSRPHTLNFSVMAQPERLISRFH